MKQKNMILVAVAVVCGLVAAFLTSQMGAKGRAPADEVQVPVAAKEITIGTRLPKDPQELAKWVKLKTFAKDSAPMAFVPTVEDMAEKYVMRTYRDGEPFNPLEVTATGMMAPPEGHGMMSLPIQADAAVSGFIRPGTRVDVWLSVLKKKSNHYVAFPMFLDMLVLAVNQDATGPQGGAAYVGVSMVSMAVKPEHTELFQLAISRGALLRLVLRHPEESKGAKYEKIPAPDKIRDILTDKEEEEPVVKAPEKEKPPETVKIKVATKEIAAQTEVTAELIASAFRDQEVLADKVPANAIRNLSEHVGRFLQKDLAENQFVPLGYLGAKKNEEAPQPSVARKDPDPTPPTPAPITTPEPKKVGPGPDDGATPKHEQPLPVLPKIAAKPKPEYTYMSVSGASGITWYRYLKLPNGESRLVGVAKAGEDEPDEPKAEKPRASDSRVD